MTPMKATKPRALFVTLSLLVLSLLGFGIYTVVDHIHLRGPVTIHTAPLSTVNVSNLDQAMPSEAKELFAELQKDSYTPQYVTQSSDGSKRYVIFASCPLGDTGCHNANTPMIAFDISDVQTMRLTGGFRLIYPTPKNNNEAYNLECRALLDASGADPTYKSYDTALPLSGLREELSAIGQKFEAYSYNIGMPPATGVINQTIWQCQSRIVM